ncbi:hypothetical protein LTR67_005385 [Exophiala xenobiotica]
MTPSTNSSGLLSSALPTTYKLKSGYDIPLLGFGTWAEGAWEEAAGEWCKQATVAALKTGYRHIDTAWVYKVEDAVGDAIRESGVPREEIFVTTKIWNQYHAPEDVEKSLESSLTAMKLDYVNLLLMHWPIAFKRDEKMETLLHPNGKPVIDEDLSTNHVPTWRAMEALVAAGKVRSIGVSNFSTAHLSALLPHAKQPIAVNQVEAHAWLPNNDLLAFCKKNDILMMAFSPLGGQTPSIKERLLDDPAVQQVAQSTGLDPGQVLLSWGLQRGTAVIPKSAKTSRIASNFHVQRLSGDDFDAIGSIHERKLIRLLQHFEEDWGVKIY